MGFLSRRRILEIFLMSVLCARAAAALSPDPKLLSMIPPSVQIVAGTGVSGGFLMFRRENAVDLRDFRAVVGVDDSKFICQFFVVAGAEDENRRVEHSLLAAGRFDQRRIYKAAIQNGGRLREYRGIQILELSPFSRNRGIFNDLRWLAIIGPDLALFGTVPNVVEELDRHEDHAGVGSHLAQRLARLNNDDATWYLMPKILLDDETRHTIGSLSSRLANAELYSAPFQFGIRHGRQIRFDFDFTPEDRTDAENASASGVRSHSGRALDDQSFVSDPRDEEQRVVFRTEIVVSRTRYERWLEEAALRQ
jgi:hypothetical protein